MSDGLKYTYVIDYSSPAPDDVLLGPFMEKIELENWNYKLVDNTVLISFRYRKDYEEFAELVNKMKGLLN